MELVAFAVLLLSILLATGLIYFMVLAHVLVKRVSDMNLEMLLIDKRRQAEEEATRRRELSQNDGVNIVTPVEKDSLVPLSDFTPDLSQPIKVVRKLSEDGGSEITEIV